LINKVNLRRARLILWWVNVSGFATRGGVTFFRYATIAIQVDSTSYPPRDVKMSTSQRPVMLRGWEVKAGMTCLQVKLCCHISWASWKMHLVFKGSVQMSRFSLLYSLPTCMICITTCLSCMCAPYPMYCYFCRVYMTVCDLETSFAFNNLVAVTVQKVNVRHHAQIVAETFRF